MIIKFEINTLFLYLLIIDFLTPYDCQVFAIKDDQERKCNRDVDLMIRSANILLRRLEPFVVKEADVKPCRKCSITGASTIYRSGNATSIVNNNLKTISFSLGLRNITANCTNCAIGPLKIPGVIGIQDIHVEIQDLQFYGNLTIDKTNITSVQLHDTCIITFGKWKLKQRGRSILSVVEDVLTDIFKSLILRVLKKKVKSNLKPLITKSAGNINMLFLLC